ncbi:MAG: prolyl-tRNA synthetase associated domain-containing protein [Alphaproteobacteria bacterium]
MTRITTTTECLDLLEQSNIKFGLYEHPPTHHFDDHRDIRDKIAGMHCKSLFLTDKKEFYMVLMRGELRLNLKALKEGLKTKRLSFAKGEDMEDILAVSPGSCTPYALVNDKEYRISKVILDEAFKGADFINFHPIENTATIQVSHDDFIKWLKLTGHNYEYMPLEKG